MALRHFGFSLQDADGDVSSVEIKVPAGAETLAHLTEFGQEMAALIDGCVDAKITEIRLVSTIALPVGLKPNPVPNCEVQKGALFLFNATGSEYKHSIRFPAWTPSKFTGKEVNQVAVNVPELIAGLLTGVDCSGTVLSPSDKHENDLVSLVSAKKSHRRK